MSAANQAATSNAIPKHVEIWASSMGANEGFVKVAAARLHRAVGEQIINLPPTRARFVKVRILSTYGAGQASLGEVKVIESPQGASILDDAPRDLARPENGGALVWFTSQARERRAAQLVWLGDATWSGPWHSADGAYGPAAYLPQDVVFAFRGDQEALVDRLVVDPTGLDLAPSNPGGLPSLAKTVAVLVSSKTPLDGFEEVGRFTIETAFCRSPSLPFMLPRERRGSLAQHTACPNGRTVAKRHARINR